MEWDEMFHQPLFGQDDVTNLVLLQKVEAGEGHVLVNAVGCHIVPENMLEFRLRMGAKLLILVSRFFSSEICVVLWLVFKKMEWCGRLFLKIFKYTV